jgi:hypothetical protein
MTKVSELVEVESEGIDFEELEGKKAKIERQEPIVVPSKYRESGKQDCLKVETYPVAEVEKDGEKIEIRASELFNLTKNKEGQLGWSSLGDLKKFMTLKKVKKPEDLVNKEVVLRRRVKIRDGQEREYLGFITK